jgi:hypothetical protein
MMCNPRQSDYNGLYRHFADVATRRVKPERNNSELRELGLGNRSVKKRMMRNGGDETARRTHNRPHCKTTG